MYHLLGAQCALDNIVALSRNFAAPNIDVTQSILKKAYHDFLISTQSDFLKLDFNELITCDPAIEQSLDNYFTPEFRVNNVDLFANDATHPDPMNRKKALQQSLEDIAQYDATLHELIHFVMHTILCTTSKKTGGTSVNPKYIGVMCAYFDMCAEQAAIPELIVHEFSHNLLFLDEHRYGHYTSYKALEQPNALIDSYYKDQLIKLPLDRVFHRMVIFVELLHLRDNMIGHDPKLSQHQSSDKLLHIMRWYIQQIDSNATIQQLMKPRCAYIYNLIKSFIENYSFLQETSMKIVETNEISTSNTNGRQS